MSFVQELEPRALWKHFDAILRIPRGSKEEGRIREHVSRIATELGLPLQSDAAGNLVVRKPASPGCEEAAVTILQGHLDMVNEKDSGSPHDFTKDPLVPRRDGEYLRATGTTLGADNGMGISAMLAVMEAKDLVHGPLELLFTVDEETGLTGASGLEGDMLAGRQFLNLDTEEEGALYVGCAGGADSQVRLPLRRVPREASTSAWRIRLHGLKGGHSGVDIHLQRGNAVKLLVRALYALRSRLNFQITAIDGGTKHNTIPREATAMVLVEPAAAETWGATLEAEIVTLRQEFRRVDPDLRLEIAPCEAPSRRWDEESERKVLNLLEALPHGVLSMSHDIEGLVETSTNLATVATQDESLLVGASSRSSVESALTAICQRIQAIGSLAGANVVVSSRYPGWKPDLDSSLLHVVKTLYAREFGREPAIKAVHAGLECGIIGEKFPGMDMISFGPRIEFPHTPEERVRIDSVGRFYRLLVVTLRELAHSGLPVR